MPRTWENTSDWWRINHAWHFRPPVDLHGLVAPDAVEAGSGHTFVITLRVGPDLTIPAGAHITLEVPSTWECHLGNPYVRGLRTVGNRTQMNQGYGAFTDVECSNDSVKLELAGSWGRHFDLVDAVVQEGEIRPGDAVRFILGPSDGCPVTVQKHAQVAVLTVGVDLRGDGEYRRAATHPTVRVVAAAAERLRVFAPAVVWPGEPFRVRVLPVDNYSFNPATRYQDTVKLTGSQGVQLPPEVDIDAERDPAGVAVTAEVARRGLYTVAAVDPQTGIAGRSNYVGAGFLEDRGIFFGEMHSQMWHSQGTGTTEEFFRWGRDAAGLDFCAPANHYRMRFPITDEIWRESLETTNRFDEPGRFVTLVSHEWGTGNRNGHKNLYYRGDFARFICSFGEGGMTPDELWARLEGQAALTIPHHTQFGNATNWSYRNDRHQRLVEICSGWGISEAGPKTSVQVALAMGHRIGFVGGTDSHHGQANQGSRHVNDGNGLACVQATALTRTAIWDALYERRCYATTGDRILLDATMDGHPVGTDLPVDLAAYGARRFHVRVAGTYRIDTVEILCNSQVVYTARPAGDVWEGEWTDAAPLAPLAIAPTFDDDRPFVFYYVRVTQANRQIAWASPFWLTQSASSQRARGARPRRSAPRSPPPAPV